MSSLNEISDNSDQQNFSNEDLQEFMQLTEADRTVALEYLAKHSGDVVVAINDYFEVMYQENVQKEDDNEKLCEKYLRKNSKLFCVLSYNIDSISGKSVKIRTEAVCNIILEELATIVLLQEITEESERIICDKLSTHYDLYSGNLFGIAEYYTLTLIRKQEWIQFKNHEVINFDETQMGRNILHVNVVIHNVELHFFNTHLESTKTAEHIRKRQLIKFFSLFDKNSSFLNNSATLIGGGDMNLRDSELNSIGGPPIGVEDAWVATGSNKILQYTWDMTRNDNLNLIGERSRFKPRMRFDRIYIRHSQPTSLGIIHFGLVGLERLKPYVCFPSDHWGVITVYEINPELKPLK